HSDVGGGHKETGLSDITLKFSFNQLESLAIEFDRNAVEKLNISPNPTAEITFVVLGGVGQRHSPRILERSEILIHRSVIERSNAKGSLAIALAQLASFSSKSSSELLDLGNIEIAL